MDDVQKATVCLRRHRKVAAPSFLLKRKQMHHKHTQIHRSEIFRLYLMSGEIEVKVISVRFGCCAIVDQSRILNKHSLTD